MTQLPEEELILKTGRVRSTYINNKEAVTIKEEKKEDPIEEPEQPNET